MLNYHRLDIRRYAPIPDGVISDPDDIYPALRNIFTVDGTWYCPPKDFSTLGLIYDPGVLEAAGVEVPTNWEELAAAAEALTTDEQVGLSLNPEFARAGAFLFQAGSGILNDAGDEVILNNGGGAEALQLLADMFTAGHAAT
ncbi:MAG: extracellular solute-binding protein, partial [Moorea sp. SIO1F2]|uniref:extracellular solute-binding protein n=1 Tax=Moorena sp. SIO1F2 TaxID=2607819 RepID=UPI0013BE28DF|nr:extracellular solute-binding protein [Moorena sp. SIO1F2]